MSQEIRIGQYYTYTKSNPLLGVITVSTQITDSGETKTKPRYGGRAFSTQKIMNNLPHWMAMRENHEGVGQQVTHAWARHLDDTIQLYDEHRANQFISTADTFGDINTGISELSFAEETVYEPRFANLLYNSSFTMLAAARLQKPEGWKADRETLDALTFNTDDALFGKYAIKLDGSSGDVVLKQTREYTQSGGSINLSIFVRTVDSEGTVGTRLAEHNAGIILVLNYADGDTKSYGLGFPANTENGWARASFSVDVEKKLFKYEVMIINRSAYTYIVDLPQLEVGKAATNWTPSTSDSPIFLDSLTRTMGPVQVLYGETKDFRINKEELITINTADEFQDLIIPTRLEVASIDVEPENSMDLRFGQETSYRDEELSSKWITELGMIFQKSISTPDVFGNACLPADLYMGEEGRLWLNTAEADSRDVYVYATTVYRNWLFAATKETYMDKSRYVLKFMRPQKLTYEDVYLQSYGDIEIPIDIGYNSLLGEPEEHIVRMGLCKNIPYTIFIDTNLRKRFYFRMKFDYVYADFRQRKLYCRENYVSNGSRLQVI